MKRQAHTMETFISMALQMVLPEVVQLTSVFLLPVCRVVILTILVAVAKSPTKKISPSPMRCFRVICNFAITGMGRPMTITSVSTLKAALAKKKVWRLMQVPGIFLFHERLTGVHSKIVRMMAMV